MKNLTFLSVIVGGILFSACSDGGKELITSLDNCPLVATFEQVGPNKVMVAHLEQMGDTLDMSLSSLVEDLYVIPLDNRDEALTKGENPHVTENYILIRPWSGEAAKLFDKEGRFICKIGDFGQGPGEYQNLYDEQIDEENNRIYLLPWQAKSVLAYDLNGNFVQSIPLAEEAPKGAVYVDTKTQRLIVGILPFQINEDEKKTFLWYQDFEGNVLHRIDAKPYSVYPDFSNEVFNDNNIPGIFDFSVLYIGARNDSLFHYEPKSSKLTPVFTMQQPSEMVMHFSKEIPNHFMLGFVTEMQQVAPGASQASRYAYIIIDKETGKGSYVRFYNDIFDNQFMPNAFFQMNNGYYIESVDPGDLAERVEMALRKSDKLTKEQYEAMLSLHRNINYSNDNTYLFVAKLRQTKSDTPSRLIILPRAE